MDTYIRGAGSFRTAQWEVEVSGGSAAVRLAGEIDLASMDGPDGGLLAAIQESLNGQAIVTCDLSKVDFLDSTGLQLLFQLKAYVEKEGAQFLVARPSDAVRRLFEVADAGSVFEIIDW